MKDEKMQEMIDFLIYEYGLNILPDYQSEILNNSSIFAYSGDFEYEKEKYSYTLLCRVEYGESIDEVENTDYFFMEYKKM